MTVAAGTSPNLALNEVVAHRRARGESIVHMGFGESRLPAFDPLVARLRAGARDNGYGPVAGTAEVREAVAGYYDRRRLPTDADQIVAGPGSKPLLAALIRLLPGDVLLPKPCWNSYVPHTRLAGKIPLSIPIPRQCGGVPDPERLLRTLAIARDRGCRPGIVVLTLPDNPTGTLAGADLIREICAIAERENLAIISDEIYRDVMHDPRTPYLSPAEVAPHRTVVTTGLSKSMALGGWRIGAARLPATAAGKALRTKLIGVASDLWSTPAAPMQHVAAYAFAEPPEIRARLADSARLHGAVARAVHHAVVSAGATCRPPAGAFYLYPDFEPLRQRLGRLGISDSASLAEHLLERLGVAVLAGHLLGDDPGALRFKCATSMLYGDTAEQQEQALASSNPVALPHIRAVLTRITEVFATLAGQAASTSTSGAFEMPDPAIRDIVTSTAADVLSVDSAALSEVDKLSDLPTFNSFRIVEVVERLEERLAVDLDPAELTPDNLTRFDRLCAMFERTVALNGAAR